MQEVKFRGIPVIPVDEDAMPEWCDWVKDGFVYGYLIGNDVIVGDIVDFEEDYFNTEFWCRVRPETVGQYTEMKDKNGMGIWGGDIVEAWSQGVKAIGMVKQRIDGLWIMFPAWQSDIFWGLCPNPKGMTTVKVIGNIHRNPELLGAKP